MTRRPGARHRSGSGCGWGGRVIANWYRGCRRADRRRPGRAGASDHVLQPLSCPWCGTNLHADERPRPGQTLAAASLLFCGDAEGVGAARSPRRGRARASPWSPSTRRSTGSCPTWSSPPWTSSLSCRGRRAATACSDGSAALPAAWVPHPDLDGTIELRRHRHNQPKARTARRRPAQPVAPTRART